MTRIAACLVLVLVMLFSNDGSNSTDRTGIREWSTPTAFAAPVSAGKPGVTGNVTITGALNGTFTWNDTLGIEHCVWEPSIQGGNFEVTMTDGAGTFISLRVIATREEKAIRLLSGKLGGDSLEGNSGAILAGSSDGKRLSATLDAPVKKGSKAATVKGKLELVCK
ncbi:MAG: hypothetical protein HY002_19610 [Candidatus Rokubacteria bacterium]|nr:hypothetical protein [Candidatus Rokubacteria bacterium]